MSNLLFWRSNIGIHIVWVIGMTTERADYICYFNSLCLLVLVLHSYQVI